MKQYLVFDSGCSVCNHLAQSIQEVAGNRLEITNIYNDQTRSLLDRAYPTGWEHAPYFVVVEENGVRAWTGIHLAARLGWQLGPRKAWKIWRLARQAGIFLPPSSHRSGHKTPRRSFLKLGASLAFGLAGISLFPSKTSACGACDSCRRVCYDRGPCYYNGECFPLNPPYYWLCHKYDCYDQYTLQYCGFYFSNCGCYACA